MAERRALIVAPLYNGKHLPFLAGAGLLKERVVPCLEGHGQYHVNAELACLPVTKARFRQELEYFFDCPGGELLLYFYGHGCLGAGQGVFATSDGEPYDWGVLMQDVTVQADNSPAHEVVLIMDCCHAGAALPAEQTSIPLTRKAGRILLAGCAGNQQGWVAKHEDQQLLGALSALALEGLEGAARYGGTQVTGDLLCHYIVQQSRSWKQSPIYSISGASRSHLCVLTYGFPETKNEADIETLRALFDRSAFSPYDYDGDPTAPLNAMHETGSALQRMGVRTIGDPKVREQFLVVMEWLWKVEAEVHARFPEVSRLAADLANEPVRTPERLQRVAELDAVKREDAIAYIRNEGYMIKGFVAGISAESVHG